MLSLFLWYFNLPGIRSSFEFFGIARPPGDVILMGANGTNRETGRILMPQPERERDKDVHRMLASRVAAAARRGSPRGGRA
ncbi:MAG: hypothetical protein OXE82_12855 [Rhodobacter sp.]|nr:hypothetical protein [Rhodobacter sp.]